MRLLERINEMKCTVIKYRKAIVVAERIVNQEEIGDITRIITRGDDQGTKDITTWRT